MFFPEFLYQLGGRDQQVSWLDPRFLTNELGIALSSLPVDLLTVPKASAFLLQSATIVGTPGLAQSTIALSIVIRPPSNTQNFRVRQESFAAVANQVQNINWSGSILIPQDWSLVAIGTFDAGAVANIVTADILGMLIPVGNIQRV